MKIEDLFIVLDHAPDLQLDIVEFGVNIVSAVNSEIGNCCCCCCCL